MVNQRRSELANQTLLLKVNLNHYKILESDFKEVKNLFTRTIISGKIVYYFFQRPITNFMLRKILKKQLSEDEVFTLIDKFLLNEGGMFKKYVYEICNEFYPLKNSTVLVPGVGYGRNLFQLATFKPKTVVCFDIYDYPGEWEFLKKEIWKEFRVKIIFLKGDFDNLPLDSKKSFDFIMSDAVLEHIKNLPEFAENSKKFLKDEGIFYASFGPLWYGPGGDHIFWGEDEIFNHLILSEEQYQENFKKKFSRSERYPTEGGFMVKNKLFSYLPTQEYFEIFSRAGFKKFLSFAKISTGAISFFRRKPEIHRLLNQRVFPYFDRYCSGLYLWMNLYK